MQIRKYSFSLFDLPPQQSQSIFIKEHSFMFETFYKINKAFVLRIAFCGLFCLLPIYSALALDDDEFGLLKLNSIGREVAFHAWGGSPAINDYIQWVASQVDTQYGITLNHVKLTNTSHAVSRILAEKIAGRAENGSVDLLWINGENFTRMKETGLLREDGWAYNLPSFRYVNTQKMPDTISDFGIPTLGLESPWGRAQFVFGYDSNIIKSPPNSAVKLLNWIKTNSGKFSYPQPPDFIGTSFLKQLLLQLVENREVLYQPASNTNAEEILEPLWKWLDEAHPFFWRRAETFPVNNAHMTRLLGDTEISIAMSFNPAEFASAIEQGILSSDVKSFIFEEGSLGNVHFVTIPYNASSPDAAKLVADFLLSPEAQLHKANIQIWGDPTVLDIEMLPANVKKSFKSLPQHPAMLTMQELQNVIPEPHPSWVKLIEEEWQKRYAAGS